MEGKVIKKGGHGALILVGSVMIGMLLPPIVVVVVSVVSVIVVPVVIVVVPVVVIPVVVRAVESNINVGTMLFASKRRRRSSESECSSSSGSGSSVHGGDMPVARVTYDDVIAAYERITNSTATSSTISSIDSFVASCYGDDGPYVRCTPVFFSRPISNILNEAINNTIETKANSKQTDQQKENVTAQEEEEEGVRIYLKCENLQKSGSFKARGALNAILRYQSNNNNNNNRTDATGSPFALVTHSSGNHALALSQVAKERGIPAYIVMPKGSPKIKKEGVEKNGGEVIECACSNASRAATAARVAKERNATFISSADDPDIIAGQGTMAIELLKQVEELDVIIAPLGGGGMLAGIITAAKGMKPGIQCIGAEPTGADDGYRGWKRGKRVEQISANTIADGLRTTVGKLNFEIIKQGVDDIILVSDEEIKAAMMHIWEKTKLIVEPSGATALAAALSSHFVATCKEKKFKRVGVILSGGNIDLDTWKW